MKNILNLNFTITLDCPKCGYIVVKYPSYYKKFTLSCECGNKIIDDFTDIYNIKRRINYA